MEPDLNKILTDAFIRNNSGIKYLTKEQRKEEERQKIYKEERKRKEADIPGRIRELELFFNSEQINVAKILGGELSKRVTRYYECKRPYDFKRKGLSYTKREFHKLKIPSFREEVIEGKIILENISKYITSRRKMFYNLILLNIMNIIKETKPSNLCVEISECDYRSDNYLFIDLTVLF